MKKVIMRSVLGLTGTLLTLNGCAYKNEQRYNDETLPASSA